jgi:hypothetical protein
MKVLDINEYKAHNHANILKKNIDVTIEYNSEVFSIVGLIYNDSTYQAHSWSTILDSDNKRVNFSSNVLALLNNKIEEYFILEQISRRTI